MTKVVLLDQKDVDFVTNQTAQLDELRKTIKVAEKKKYKLKKEMWDHLYKNYPTQLNEDMKLTLSEDRKVVLIDHFEEGIGIIGSAIGMPSFEEWLKRKTDAKEDADPTD